MTAEERTTAEDLIAGHRKAHTGIPHNWAGYPGLCLICYQAGIIQKYREHRKALHVLMAAAASLEAEKQLGIDRELTKYEMALNDSAETALAALEEADPL